MRFERRKSNVEEIERIANRILSLIPKGKEMTPFHGDVIAKRWDGSKFVEFVNPVVYKEASEQKMVSESTKSVFPWAWVTAVASVLVVVGLAWFFRKRSQSLVICIVLVFAVSTATAGEGPYCGLFCVQAASAAIGRPCDFQVIKTPDFLHGNPGSTADDLVRALAIGDLTGTPRNGITAHELRVATEPYILHTRSPGAKSYSHWIVFLGMTSKDTRCPRPQSHPDCDPRHN